MLGRKSGRGIYDYSAGSKPPLVDTQTLPLPSISHLQLHSPAQDALTMADWQARLQAQGIATDLVTTSDWTGMQTGDLQLRQTDGRPASAVGAQVVVYDWHVPQGGAPVLAYAAASGVSVDNIALAQALLSTLGFAPQRVADQPGLVAARTLAMLINEAADAVQQGVCEPAGADAAMKLGVNYPAGPFEWLARWGAPAVVQVLEALDAHYRGERYRVSPWLRHALWQAQPTA
jgi:3-hydroxybutyryl-CoA dehydrogenase